MRACWSSVSRNTGKELEEAKAKVEIAFGHGSNIVGTAEHSRYTVRISKFALRIMLEYLDKVIRITDKKRLKRGWGKRRFTRVEGNVLKFRFNFWILEILWNFAFPGVKIKLLIFKKISEFVI